MIYNTMYMGGVLVHGERAHKYLQKIKTKTGKWRYIYTNTKEYNKNRRRLDDLLKQGNRADGMSKWHVPVVNKYPWRPQMSPTTINSFAGLERDERYRLTPGESAGHWANKSAHLDHEKGTYYDRLRKEGTEYKKKVDDSLQEITKRKVNKLKKKFLKK